jgi:hypothetical protein
MGTQTMWQAARLAASRVQTKRRRQRAERDRRLERLAIEVLSALGERDATVAATEHRAGAALLGMETRATASHRRNGRLARKGSLGHLSEIPRLSRAGSGSPFRAR